MHDLQKTVRPRARQNNTRSRHRGDPGETLAGAECNGVRTIPDQESTHGASYANLGEPRRAAL